MSMVNKAMQICKDLEWAPESKTKCYSLHNASLYVVCFTAKENVLRHLQYSG